MKRIEAEKIMENIKKESDSDCKYDLKRCFGQMYNSSLSPKVILATMKATNLQYDNLNMPSAFYVSSMFYAFDENDGETKFQDIMREIYHNPDSTSSIIKDIEELLTIRNIDSSRFITKLKRIALVGKFKNKSFDYTLLLYDLANWDIYETYKKWANTIIIE